ncbi:phosphotransferase [Paenibacillus sp. An7]|uniref:phosphotransferase n=1 Tax=Paenibacillus sp. An7 TaxID=2689577 RepID=UPI0013578F9E
MHGGAQKVVYKINCSNGFSFVLYVWDLSMNYFKEDIVNNDIYQQSYGSSLFELNNNYLIQNGIQTPSLYELNKDRTRYPFDYAMVEYIHGEKAETYFHHSDPRVQDRVFQRLGDMLTVMHGNKREVFGKANQNNNNPEPCHMEQFNNAKIQLSYCAQYMENIRAHHDKIIDTLYTLESKIKPRTQYGFIHGELGPDHVLINKNLEPYLIDIEGAGFFDIEHEHSFLEFRFGDYYRYLKNGALDPDRMLFYKFHHHISLTSGGLKLQHRGFSNSQFAIDLANYHADCLMQFVEG